MHVRVEELTTFSSCFSFLVYILLQASLGLLFSPDGKSPLQTSWICNEKVLSFHYKVNKTPKCFL